MKKNILIILIFIVFISCNNSETKPIISSEKTVEIEQGNITKSERIIKPTHKNTLHCDSITVEGSKFLVCQSDSLNLFIIDYKNDTIYKNSNWVHETEFIDLNGDGYIDILLHYLTNVTGINDLALYDKSTRNFKIVNNFDRFPSPSKISGTKYYFSYHRSGCADLNWDSDLFILVNYQAICIGNISGRGCEGEKENGKFISKVKGGKKKLIRKIIKEVGYYDDKWNFIEKYWTENYKNFL